MNASLARQITGPFASKISGQFAPVLGGQFTRFLHIEHHIETRNQKSSLGNIKNWETGILPFQSNQCYSHP